MENDNLERLKITKKKPIKKTKVEIKIGPKVKSHTSKFFENSKMGRNEVKHIILKSYLNGWFPIMSKAFPYSPIVFVDGFAGCGMYNNTDLQQQNENPEASYGSPLVIFEALHNHTNMNDVEKASIILIFVELNKKHAESLEANLAELKTRLDSQVRFYVRQDTFVNAIEGILDQFKRGPMFIFADPFGFNGDTLPMDLMRKIIARDTVFNPTELLLTCMDGFANRWFKNRNVTTLNKFLGQSDNWRSKIFQLKLPSERREKFISMYIESLGQEMVKENEKFPEKRPKKFYPLKFSIRNKMNRHIYHLLFITFHKNGLKQMKYSMNRISQESNGQNIYSEFATTNRKPRDHLSELNDIIPDVIRRLKEAVQECTDGIEIYDILSGYDVADFILIETPYHFNFRDDFVAWFFGTVIKTLGTTFETRFFELGEAKYPEEFYKRREKRLKAKEAKRLRDDLNMETQELKNRILPRSAGSIMCSFMDSVGQLEKSSTSSS